MALHSLLMMNIASGVSPADARVQKNSFPDLQGLFSILIGAMLLLKFAQYNWISL